MRTLLFIVGVSFLLWLSTGRAADYPYGHNRVPDASGAGEKCNRGYTYDWLMNPANHMLNDKEKEALKAKKPVLKTYKQPSGYEMGYVFAVAPYDPELVMGVFASVDEQAGKNGLGDFILKSKAMPSPAGTKRNRMIVYYKQAGELIFDGSEYQWENTLIGAPVTMKDSEEKRWAYLMDSKLIDSSDTMFSPRWADAFFAAHPHPDGTFVSTCNYMVPWSDSFFTRGSFNNLSRDRLGKSAENLTAWIGRIVTNPAAADKKRQYLQFLLSDGF